MNKSMPEHRQARQPRQPRTNNRAGKTPAIDNRNPPSTEEVAQWLKVPPTRVRQLKQLADKILAAPEPVR